jgi:arylsulfatase A-like enzyme
MNKMTKNRLGWLLVLVWLVGCHQPDQSADRPNILFIMADDHTSQAWGIYGGILQDHVRTPNITRLADEGCVLNQCLVSNSICVPSRATILTGQYSHVNGVKTLSDGLVPEWENIAKELQKGGYQTSIVGKWHLKKEPSGFDYYCVLPGQGRYQNPVLRSKEDFHSGGKQYEGYSADVIADLTIDWIRKRDTSKPFFTMCHFKATHEPFDYPERHADLYNDVEIPAPASLFDEGAGTTGRSFLGQSLDNLMKRYLDASENPDLRKGYMQYPGLPFSVEGLTQEEARMKTYQKFVKDFMRCGAAIDDNIGSLLKYLDDSGLAENTIVIYTADQGYFLGEHGFFDKRMIYEESMKMPFVIRYEKEIPAGTRNDDLIENVDFSALFADYAGVKYPEAMQGYSFRENLKGHAPDGWRQNSYYHYWQNAANRPAHFGIRTNRYKLAFFYGKGLLGDDAELENDLYWEFYDLEKDFHELHNAYQEETYQTIIERMKKDIFEKQKELRFDLSDYPDIQKVISHHWED